MKHYTKEKQFIEIIPILRAALENDASDIIITAETPPMLRIDGDLFALGNRVFSAEDTKNLIYSVLDESQVAKFEQNRELDFSISVNGHHRFRGNAYMQRGSVGGVFRLIPTVIPSLKELQLPSTLKKICNAHSGLFLITGATGMGKSTTLASMIGEINNNRNCHVVTIEDPIEFVHKNISSVIDQRELGTDTFSFAEAIKQSLRQSPDVILVGEMRDLETMMAAITAAETGHLVFATLHTRNSVQSIDRIIDSFPSSQQNQIREQLSSSLLGILSQRLFLKASGKGRVVATELLLHNTAVGNLIRERKSHQISTVLDTHRNIGMHSFEARILELVDEGKILKSDAEAFLSKTITF